MTHLTATEEEFVDFLNRKSINPKGMKILDVGCKYNNTIPFFKNKLGMEWEGIDVMPYDIEVKQMDMTNLENLEANYYDFVFVCHSLEHCYNPFQALGEFKEVLKDGGWLFISLPCYCDFHLEEIDHLFLFTEKQIKKLVNFIKYVKVECYKSKFVGYDDDKLYNIICVGEKDINTNKIIFQSQYIAIQGETLT